MFSVQPAAWLVVALAAGPAGAQQTGQPAQLAASQPAAAQPWRSAIDSYRPFTDEKVAPWRETNDTVGRIGGWRAYAREVQGGAAQPLTPASSAPRSGAAHQHQEPR